MHALQQGETAGAATEHNPRQKVCMQLHHGMECESIAM